LKGPNHILLFFVLFWIYQLYKTGQDVRDILFSIPMPLSLTKICTLESIFFTATVTAVLFGLYFIALSRRIIKSSVRLLFSPVK